jgi:membrane protein
MPRVIPKLLFEAAPIAMLAGAGVLALRGPEARSAGGHGPPRHHVVGSPLQIAAVDWRRILVRTKDEFFDDQVPMIAGGVAFFTLLAIFPALAAFVSLYGLFADIGTVQHHLHVLSFVLPASALKFFGEQMVRMAEAQKGGLSLTFAVGLATSIWSGNGAMKALMTGLNIAYEVHDKRSFIRKTLISMAFTLGLLVFGISSVGVLGAGPAVETYLGSHAALMVNLISWPLLVVGMGVGVALLYCYGPARSPPRLQWITPGSVAAMVLWLAMSALFSLYVGNFAHYDKTYGPLGAAVGFMMWSWLSYVVILVGAELNSEVEAQTAANAEGAAKRARARAA